MQARRKAATSFAGRESCLPPSLTLVHRFGALSGGYPRPVETQPADCPARGPSLGQPNCRDNRYCWIIDIACFGNKQAVAVAPCAVVSACREIDDGDRLLDWHPHRETSFRCFTGKNTPARINRLSSSLLATNHHALGCHQCRYFCQQLSASRM